MNPSRALQLVVCLGFTASAFAQAAPSAPSQLPDAPSASQQAPATKHRFGLGHGDLFVVDAATAKPLTAREKGALFLHSSVQPITFLWPALTAGISQAADGHSGYGQGAEGYGKRYGAALADQVDGQFWSKYALPVLFKQDPRYYRLGKGGFWNRSVHAGLSAFVTHTDSGKRTFNSSNVLGNVIAGSISNAYYPEKDRGADLTFINAAIVTGMSGATAVFNEFWPDVRCKLGRKQCQQQKDAAAKAEAAPAK